MSKTFAEMQEMYKEVAERFGKIELQEWKAEGGEAERGILSIYSPTLNFTAALFLNNLKRQRLLSLLCS